MRKRKGERVCERGKKEIEREREREWEKIEKEDCGHFEGQIRRQPQQKQQQQTLSQEL